MLILAIWSLFTILVEAAFPTHGIVILMMKTIWAVLALLNWKFMFQAVVFSLAIPPAIILLLATCLVKLIVYLFIDLPAKLRAA